MSPQEGQEGLDREALFSLQETMGAHTTHKTKEYRHYNTDGSHKKAGGLPKPDKPASGMNFAPLIHKETMKTVRSALKKFNRGRKHHNRHEESDSNSDSDY